MHPLTPIVLVLAGIASFSSPAPAQFVTGDLYISDAWTNHVYRVESGTWTVTTFADFVDTLDGPSALLLSSDRKLLCSNFVDSNVLEFDAAGNVAVRYDEADGLDAPFGMNGLAYDSGGDLYVSDALASTIWRFPAAGGAPTAFADAADGIVMADGIAFAPNGDLYVANRDGYEVLKIDPAGNATVFDPLPANPFSIVVRRNGDVYVAVENPMNVYRYPGGDASKRKVLVTMTKNSGMPAMALSLDGTKLYYTTNGTGNLWEIDADSGAKTELLAPDSLYGAISIAVIPHLASWANYGVGVAGTNGVPSFTSQQDPELGATITLDLANSRGQPTSGLLLLGFQQANLPTGFGGEVLLLPALVVPIAFSYGGNSYTGTLPIDPALSGLEVDLQAVEFDPGAVKGVSFTQGLQLLLGF